MALATEYTARSPPPAMLFNDDDLEGINDLLSTPNNLISAM
jgi:hypothetical protein